MTNLIWACRYLLIGVLVVSNAIVCSVGVWNFFIAEEINYNLQIDGFLIAVAALTILFILFIIICGLIRRNSVVARVWFECVWVGVLFSLQFSGAVAITSIVPSLMCPDSVDLQLVGSCASTQVLMAFTWISAIVLLAYFLLLFISAFVFAKTDSRIWNRAVRHFSLSDVPDSAAPLAPEAPKRWSIRSIVAPRPRHPAPASLYAFSGGFGSNPEREIEPSHARSGSTRRPPAPPIPTAPVPQHMIQRARSAGVTQVSSFYPQQVQTAMAEANYNTNTLTQVEASPPPLGDWPRVDVLSQPVRDKGKGKARMSFRASSTSPSSNSSTSTRVAYKPRPLPTTDMRMAPSVPPVAVHPTRPRPSGPRTRGNSRDWSRPPPLDLSNISSYERRRGS